MAKDSTIINRNPRTPTTLKDASYKQTLLKIQPTYPLKSIHKQIYTASNKNKQSKPTNLAY